MKLRATALALVTLVACKAGAPAGSGAVDAESPSAVDAAPSPRCTLEASGVTLGSAAEQRATLFGEAAPTNDGFAVGLVRSVASGPEAAVARVTGHRVAEEWIVAKRAEVVPDAPPPLPLVGPGVLYAAYVANVAADAGPRARRVVLARAGTAAPVASFPDAATESLAFDAAMSPDVSHAAIVWDDDSEHGGIRLAIVSVVPLVAAPAVGPRLVSDGVTDVDGPRVAPRAGGGWWVAWIARRDEAGDAGNRPEAPSEARSSSWVELIALDAAGVAVGPIRKLTAPTGHVASFDLAPRPHGELDVFVRDETQAREGEGGRILHVVVHDATVEDAVTVVPEGVGRGAVDLLVGGAGEAWLAYVDGVERPRLIPLGESRVPTGPATTEEGLGGARFLALTGGAGHFAALVAGGDSGGGAAGGAAGGGAAADGSDSAPSVRDVVCTR